VPGSKRQRELARRRAERQAERRAAAARKRRQRTIITSTGLGVLLLVLAVFLLTRGDDKEDAASPSATESTTPTDIGSETEAAATPKPVACGAQAPTPATPQTFPSEPPMTIDKTKKYIATIKTSCGTVEVELFADKAPITINSFNFLASKKFFDGSRCHRLLSGADSVLQCGDPTGTGSGDLGYTIKDENLPKADESGGYTYPAGTLAMANTGAPDSGSSQFFFVIKDSPFGASYTPFGKVTKGLDVLEKILEKGHDGKFEPTPGGGEPKEDVFIESFTVTAA
jgi:peptidyl-prolyl cis-trans isomerase B (cyclophilin B)